MEARFSDEFQKRFRKFNKDAREKILKAVNRIKENPMKGKPLRYNLKGLFSERLEKYRIIYEIEKNIIFFVTIRHRKEVYERGY